VWTTYKEDKCIQLVVDGTVGMTTLGRPRRRWKYNIKVHLENKMVYGLDLFGSERDKQQTFVKTVANIRVP
jgi:hypothetical protein